MASANSKGMYSITCGECHDAAINERNLMSAKTGFKSPMLIDTVISGKTLPEATAAFAVHVEAKHPEKLEWLWESLQMTYYARPKP